MEEKSVLQKIINNNCENSVFRVIYVLKKEEEKSLGSGPFPRYGGITGNKHIFVLRLTRTPQETKGDTGGQSAHDEVKGGYLRLDNLPFTSLQFLYTLRFKKIRTVLSEQSAAIEGQIFRLSCHVNLHAFLFIRIVL